MRLVYVYPLLLVIYTMLTACTGDFRILSVSWVVVVRPFNPSSQEAEAGSSL